MRKTRGSKTRFLLDPGATFGPNTEYKYNSFALATIFNSVSTTDAYQDMLANIVQGLDTFKNRIGNVIQTKTLEITGSLVGGQANSVTDDVRNIVRAIAFWGTPGLTITGISVSSLFGPDFQPGVRKVLFDKQFVLETLGKDSTGYLAAQKLITIKVPCPNSIRYYGTGVNTVTSESLYVMVVTDSSTIPNPGFASGQALVTYLDH